MAKNGKNNDVVPGNISFEEVPVLQTQYMKELERNPQFSLKVDPLNKYNMSPEQKKFIEQYVQFKNIPLACQICGISEKEGQAYFLSYSSQQEIRRINLAMYHRQFSTRLLTLDEIGGYLTSVLVDENVAYADRLEAKDKLRVAQMIIDLNDLKRKAMLDPVVIDAVDVTEQIKDLSVDSIKRLLDSATADEKTIQEKNDAIDKLNTKNQLSGEEIAYLKTLPLSEVLALLEKGNEKK